MIETEVHVELDPADLALEIYGDLLFEKLDGIAQEIRREIDLRTLELGRTAGDTPAIDALRWALSLVEAETE